MIVDGKALAQIVIHDIAAEIAKQSTPPSLAIFTCEPNFETQKFLAIKQKQATVAGISLTRCDLTSDVTLAEVTEEIQRHVKTHDGIIIQFPFPHIKTSDLIPLIPSSHDVDVFSYDGTVTGVLPPVVGAIDEISKQFSLSWQGKQVVVVGEGRLVGAPAVRYAKEHGAKVTVVTKESGDLSVLRSADIVISGAGVPHLLTPDMVKEGVVIFDAGTSEEGGQLCGDVSPLVAEKAAIFTPVPGGIGPLTVAVLLRNLLLLSRQ